MTDLVPAEVFHPSIFIKDELAERGWNLDMLAMRMGPEFGVNRLSLDLYLDVGPTEPNLLLGEITSKALGHAFGVSPDFFLNLHKSWRDKQGNLSTDEKTNGGI